MHELSVLSIRDLRNQFHYYPFGAQIHGRSFSSGTPTKEKFTGKERDTETGLDYFGAWYYDAEIGRFLSVDPLVKPHESPYASFANNPLRFIDPNGMDTVEVQQGSGEMVSHTEADGEDVFFIVDEDGNRIEDQSITFEEGTLVSVKQPTEDTEKGPVQMTLYRLKGDKNGQKLFEFFSDPKNTKVEWSHAKIGTQSSGSNIVGTNNWATGTAVGHYLRVKNYTLREVVHNHPGGSWPSGFPGGKRGDIPNAVLYQKSNPNVVLKVYIHPGEYVPYDDKGVYIIVNGN